MRDPIRPLFCKPNTMSLSLNQDSLEKQNIQDPTEIFVRDLLYGLAYIIMVVEKSHDLLSTSWIIRPA